MSSAKLNTPSETPSTRVWVDSVRQRWLGLHAKLLDRRQLVPEGELGRTVDTDGAKDRVPEINMEGASEPKQTLNRLLTVGLLVVQALLSLIAILLNVGNNLMVDSCTAECDYRLITFSNFLILIGIPVIYILLFGWSIRLRNSSRRSWTPPLVGTAAAVVLFFVSWQLLATGMHITIGDFFAPG
jgi:hypothetical protein